MSEAEKITLRGHLGMLPVWAEFRVGENGHITVSAGSGQLPSPPAPPKPVSEYERAYNMFERIRSGNVQFFDQKTYFAAQIREAESAARHRTLKELDAWLATMEASETGMTRSRIREMLEATQRP